MRKLPRQVILLGWVSFFADVSGEMIYPLLPLFVVGVLGASATSLGWVEGSATAVVAVMTAIAGWRSDRIVGGFRRRAAWVRWGYGLPVLGKAILALAFAWPVVLAGRLIDRLGKGLRSSPRDALIADAVEPPDRGRAFGVHRAMDTAGALVGVLLSAVLLWWFTGTPAADPEPHSVSEGSGGAFRAVFAVAAALGLISWAVTWFVRDAEVRDDATGPVSTPDAVHEAAPDSARTSTARAGFSSAYWRTVALMLIFALANSSDGFLLLRASQVGLEPWAVVLAYALFNLTYTAVSYPAGILSDRIGRWRVMAVGWLIYAAVYAGFAFAGSVGVWGLMALYGIYMALTDGVGKALVADKAPPHRRGAALGIYYMAYGLTTLIASVLAGVVWDRFGAPAAFGMGGAIALVAVLLIPVLRPGGEVRSSHTADVSR